MANITINGAKYNDVPRVDVPSQSGGVSSFYETNGTLSVTENGTYDVKSKENVAVNVASSGGEVDTDALISGAYWAGKDVVYNGSDNIGKCKFANTELRSFVATSTTRLEEYAFDNCSKLVSFEAPNVTSVGQVCFRSNVALISLNLKSLKSAEQSAFVNCRILENADFQSLESLGFATFAGCKALKRLKFPKIKSIGTAVFINCNALEIIEFSEQGNSNVITFGSSTFTGCTSLKALVLRNGVVNTLGGTSDYLSPTIEDRTGFIYVPRTLLETYKTATNWSVYAEQFRALEDYTVDGTLSGDIDETKI